MKPIKMEVQFGNVGSIMFFHITIVIFKVGKEQITEKKHGKSGGSVFKQSHLSISLPQIHGMFTPFPGRLLILTLLQRNC
jgi:hypothetical protein